MRKVASQFAIIASIFLFLMFGSSCFARALNYYIVENSFSLSGDMISLDCFPIKTGYWASSSLYMGGNVGFYGPCTSTASYGTTYNVNDCSYPSSPSGSPGTMYWDNGQHNACGWVWQTATSSVTLTGAFDNWAANEDGIYYFRIFYMSGYTNIYTGDYFKMYLSNHIWLPAQSASLFDVFPSSPPSCQTTNIQAGLVNISGKYVYKDLNQKTGSLLITLWDSAQAFGYRFPVTLTQTGWASSSYSVGAELANGDYSVTYQYVTGQSWIDSDGNVHFSDDWGVSYPFNNDDLCMGSTIIHVEGSSFASTTQAEYGIGSYIGPIYASSTEICDQIGLVGLECNASNFLQEWSNKFVTVIRARFPFNYLLTLTDWLGSFNFNPDQNTNVIASMPMHFDFGQYGGSFTVYASSTMLASLGNNNTNVGNDNTHTIFYWTRLFSQLFILYCLILWSYEFIYRLFFNTGGGTSYHVPGT